MNQTKHTIPLSVGKLLAKLPANSGTFLFVSALNMTLSKHLPTDVKASLINKKLRIRVIDAQRAFDFKWSHNRFCAHQHLDNVDLIISASAYDFFLLAKRLEDPDTLFFSRRLIMEGDTELGLLVKNSIDAIELPLLNFKWPTPPEMLVKIKDRVLSSF
jgi:O2-independent ubiquinone biosynthesis accessory factor UbiT